jgi:hypothetical protein
MESNPFIPMFDLCNNVDYVGLRETNVLEQTHAPLNKNTLQLTFLEITMVVFFG